MKKSQDDVESSPPFFLLNTPSESSEQEVQPIVRPLNKYERFRSFVTPLWVAGAPVAYTQFLAAHEGEGVDADAVATTVAAVIAAVSASLYEWNRTRMEIASKEQIHEVNLQIRSASRKIIDAPLIAAAVPAGFAFIQEQLRSHDFHHPSLLAYITAVGSAGCGVIANALCNLSEAAENLQKMLQEMQKKRE